MKLLQELLEAEIAGCFILAGCSIANGWPSWATVAYVFIGWVDLRTLKTATIWEQEK